MEDSSLEGWTTMPPSAPPGQTLGYVPEGRMLPGGPPGGWVGQIRSTTPATDDAIRFASRTWKQVQPKDFDRDGRRFTERATGVVYDLCHGNPLLADNADVADAFLVADDALLFLRRSDRPQARSQWIGTMGAMQVRS